MGVINSMPRAERVNLEASTQEIKRVNSSSDEKVSSIAKDRISTLGRIFRVSLRLTLVVILLPAFLLKSIYDMALFVIKGKKPEQKIDESPKLTLEPKKEETKDLIQDLPLETPGSAVVIKEPNHDNSKDLAQDKSDKTEEIVSPLPINQGCYDEKEKQLEALLNPFVDRKEIKEETAASKQPSFSFSDILGCFKPLFFSTNKMSSEKDLEELRGKFNQMELNESTDLQKQKVQQKKVQFNDEVLQPPIPLKSKILHPSISHALNIDVVEKKEKEVSKKSEPEQKQPIRTSARLAEKKEKERSFAPLVQTPPKKKEEPKKPEPEQKQPVRTSARLAEKKEKQADKATPAAPASSKKAPAKKSKPIEPEATPPLRRSARLAAKNK